MDPVEHGVAAGVEAAALTGRVELASGRERREELVSMRVQALGVLIPLRGPRALALRGPADRSGHATGDGSATGVLEDRGQPQDFTCAHRRLRVVGSQVAVFCDRNRPGDDVNYARATISFLRRKSILNFHRGRDQTMIL